MPTKIIFDINSEEGEEDRTTISINGIGEVVLVETYPEYEFLDDVGEDALEELNLSTEDVIGKIEHLEIKDKYKGQGYAKLLMKKAIAVAKEKGLMPLYLNASPMGSKRYGLNLDDLTGFYESLGFEVFLRQGGNNLMILKDTYKTGGETKNKIMAKQIKIQFEDNYANGGVTYIEWSKDNVWQEQFNDWKEDGNVSKNADGTYSTQDAQYTNSLKGISGLKKYFYNEFIRGQYAGGGKAVKKYVVVGEVYDGGEVWKETFDNIDEAIDLAREIEDGWSDDGTYYSITIYNETGKKVAEISDDKYFNELTENKLFKKFDLSADTKKEKQIENEKLKGYKFKLEVRIASYPDNLTIFDKTFDSIFDVMDKMNYYYEEKYYSLINGKDLEYWEEQYSEINESRNYIKGKYGWSFVKEGNLWIAKDDYDNNHIVRLVNGKMTSNSSITKGALKQITELEEQKKYNSNYADGGTTDDKEKIDIESIDYSLLTENEFENLAFKVKSRNSWSDYLAFYRFYNVEITLNKIYKNCFKSVDFVELFKQYPIVADAKIGRIEGIEFISDEILDKFTLNFIGGIDIEYNRQFYDTNKGWGILDKYTVDIYIKNIDRFIKKFLTFKVSTLNFDEFKREYIKALNTPSDAILEYMAKKELNDKGENIKGSEDIGLKEIDSLLNQRYDGLTEKERKAPYYIKSRNDFRQLKAKIEALMLKYRNEKYSYGGRTMQNIAKKQARKDIKTHLYRPQFPDVSSIKPSEKWARYELPYDTKLQYDFEPDSFSVQGKRYSEYADGGEIKVNGMTKEDYIDAFQNRVEKLIQELKEEGTYDENTFDFLYEIIEKGRDGGFTDIEETGFWLSDGDNRLAYYLSFDKNVGYRDYTDKVLSHFYFGKPMKIEFVLKTSGDTELAFEDELQKIKLLSNKIDFNKVVGVIDYEKTKNNTDLDFYKNIELVMSLNGDWDETTEELDTIIDVNGEMAYLNYHPLDSMGGVNMQQLKKNINEAFKELNTYSAVVSIEGYEEYAENVEGLENAKSVIQNIKGNTRFQVLKGSSVGIGKRVDNSRVVEEYAKGGEAGFDDTGTSMVMYHEKKGNFFVAKDTVYLWFYNVENSAEKIESGEFDYVLYPFSSLGMMGQKGFIPPLKKIWTKKFQKKTKGSEHLLGVIKAFLIEEKGKKELYIDMMSVNPTKKKKGVMSYMIKDLRNTFDLTQEQITFSDLTDEGKKFLAKKTYDDGGGIGDEGKLKFEDLVGKYFEIELGSSGTSTEWESKELLAYLKKVVTHNLFDSEFYYNWTDSDEKKQYLDIFTNDTLNEIFKNVTNALNKYFEFKTTAYSTNTKVLVFKCSNDFRDDWIDNWFKTNKKISVKLKVDYKRYREKYAGVTPYADGGEASELNIGQIFEVNRDSEKGKKYFDFHYGKGYVFIISDIFNEKVIDENQFWDAHIKLKVYDSNLKYIFPIRVFFKGKPYGLNLTKKLFSELLSDKSIFPSDNYYVEKESDYDRQEREFKGNGYVELIKRKINPIWKSIIDKFSEIYFSNGTDNDYLVSDQVKARGSNPYSSYEFRNFSPLLSWADAEGKFKQSLTADELNSIEISYNTEEYADLEEHDTEKYHKQIVVKLKTYADGGGIGDEEKGQWFKDLIHTQYPFEPMIIVTPKYSLQSNNTNRLEYNELIEYLDNHGWMYEKNNWSLNDMELPIINIFINQRKEKSSTTLSDLKLWLSLKNWDYVNKYADGGDVKNKIQLKNFSDLKQGDVIRKKERHFGTTIFVVNKSPVQSRIYKNEYDVLVTCIVSNTNFYKPFEEYSITSVIKYGKLGNVDYLGKWNYDDKIDYSIYLPKSNKKYADGGNVPHADKMFQLPLEMVIYVPSTQNVNKVISIDDMILRVDEVKKYLANKFGGYTSADKLGGYVDSTGNLVNEDVVQVTSFSTKEAYAENKEELINQLAKWCEEWGQESIGFEFEGDLMYVPNKFKKGGRTKNM